MSKSTKPFRYRGRWRATLTLPNGLRPTKDFESYDDALLFLAEQRAIASDMNAPELGGPTMATLAQALAHYAQLMTVCVFWPNTPLIPAQRLQPFQRKGSTISG